MKRPRSYPVSFAVGETRSIIVSFRYSPGRAGSMYQRNGDPGDPPEPAEVEPHDAVLVNEEGDEWLTSLDSVPRLTGHSWEYLCDEAIERIAEQLDGEDGE